MSNGVNSFWQDYKEFMYDNGLDLHIENVWAFLEEHGRVDSFSERDLEEARNEAADEAYEMGLEDGRNSGYDDGYDDGDYEGYRKGYDEGYDEGYQAAKDTYKND